MACAVPQGSGFFLAPHSPFSYHNHRDWQSLTHHGEWTVKTYTVIEKWKINQP